MADYETPSWGKKPDEDKLFRLEVLKSGQIIQILKLHDKDHFILGRQPDICDFCLEHSSISRKHAVLQYRDDNALMLINFGGNGSYINKKACSNGVFHRVYVGDIIKFGESSRLYLVEGPEEQRPGEHDSANMQAYRAHLGEKSKRIEKDKESTESEGVGWGFREDAVNEDYVEDEGKEDVDLPDYIKKDENYDRKYGDKFSSSLHDEDVNEKDLKLLEKVRKHERKIQNMQEEISRIYMKEGKQDEGLTAGQAAAVERNDKRIEVLKAELTTLEAQIRGKQAQRAITESNSSSSQRKHHRRDQEVEEGALDTTAETMDASTNWRLKRKLRLAGGAASGVSKLGSSTFTTSGSLTFAGLQSELESEQSALEALLRQVEQLRSVIVNAGGIENGKTSLSSSSSEQQLDGLDAYMRDSVVQEAESSLKRLLAEVDEKQVVLKRLRKLLKVAAPALSSLHRPAQGKEKHLQVIETTEVSDVNPEQVLGTNTTDQENMKTTEDVKAKPDDEFISRSAFHSKCSSSVVNKRPADASAATATLAKRKKNGDEEETVPSSRGSNNFPPPLDAPVSVAKQTEKNKGAVLGPSPHSIGDSGSVSVTDSDLGTKKRDPQATCPAMNITGQSTAALHASHSGEFKEQVKRWKEKKATRPGPLPTGSYNSSTLEGGEAVWCPPKNQSGDGKTSLNAKYGY